MSKLSKHTLLPIKAIKPLPAVWSWAILLTLQAGFCALAWLAPILTGGAVFLISVAGWIISVCEHNRILKMAAMRPGDSICTFARSFERRSIDTRIIRAVYEELTRYYKGELAIRATDSFKNDLRLDPEDLEDIASDVAYRCRRSMHASRENPFYGRVLTVRDLIFFFSHQPAV